MRNPQMSSTPFYQTPPTWIDIGSAEIAYWRVGQGPELVFLHGWPVHSSTYRELVPLLSDSFTCHLFDLPGAGQTREKAPADFLSIAGQVKSFLQKLSLSRYALLAHDSGALLARLLAADNPQVAALVIGDTEIPHYHPPVVQLMVKLARIPGGLVLLRMLMKSRSVRRSKLGFAGCFTNPDWIDGEFHTLVTKPLLASHQALERAFAPLKSFDFQNIDRLEEIHRRIAAPVCLIWGTKDPIFPMRRAKEMAKQFPNGAAFYEIEGGRAFAHEDHAGAFASFAKPFLQRAFSQEQAVSH